MGPRRRRYGRRGEGAAREEGVPSDEGRGVGPRGTPSEGGGVAGRVRRRDWGLAASVGGAGGWSGAERDLIGTGAVRFWVEVVGWFRT